MLIPEVRELQVGRIKFAPYNPPSRIADNAIKPLMHLMAEHGMPYPILVSPEYFIIDGHRRTVCARRLDWPTIQAIVLNGIPDTMYAALNAATRRMTGAERLYVWVKKPSAVTVRQAALFDAMQQVIGRKLVVAMVDRGLSTSVYRVACELSRYCGEESTEFIVAATNWLLTYPIIGRVREAMKAGYNRRKLVKAVTENSVFEFDG